MNDFDYLSLDGRSLRVFLTVLELGSVTAAADHLGITQSAVSHTLEKLRGITGDALFVKAGRGIVATAHAEALASQARSLLEGMRHLAMSRRFEPGSSRHEFVIAANDYQRELLLPPVMQTLCGQAPGIKVRVIPSGMPTVEDLREGNCDLIIAAEPPSGSDVLSEHLIDDQLVCFYDPAHAAPPASMEEYLAARHIGIRFNDSERADMENRFRARGIHRNVALVVDNVSSILGFLHGTRLLAIAPRMVNGGLSKGLAWAEPPFETPLLSLHMVWHRRHEHDAAHQWLRDLVRQSASAVRQQHTSG